MSEKVNKEVPLFLAVIAEILRAKNFDQKTTALKKLGYFLQTSEFSQKVNGLLLIFEVNILVHQKQLNKKDFYIWLDQLLDWLESFLEVPEDKRNAEQILDLSNHSTKEDECLDLAKNISAVMRDKNTPVGIYNALSLELNVIDTVDFYTPENVAKIICKDGEK